jgi:Zn-dependent protease
VPLIVKLPLMAIWHLIIGLFDVVVGRRRRSYGTSTHIAAPRALVWQISTGSDITFDGPVPIIIRTEPRGDNSGLSDSRLTIGDRVYEMVFRTLEEHPEESLVIELMKDGTEPSFRPGENYIVSVQLADEADGTRLGLIHELDHTTLLGRVTVPLGVIQNAERVKHHAEKLAGTAQTALSRGIKAAAITGLLTLASFAQLLGWSEAAILLFVILIHEAGHVLAMRWFGIPIRGIYFIPFFGGVAVAASRFHTEAERGVIALMGPGLSVLTTGLFYLAALHDDDETMRQVALISALLNGFNLLPFVPLDGGHVLGALLSRVGRDVGDVAQLCALAIGAAAALYLEWYLLALFLMLGLPPLLRAPDAAPQLLPLSRPETLWLAVGFVSTFAFFAAVAYQLW